MIDPMRLNLRHLEALAAAGRLGTISAASRELHLSQPAVTQAIASLEKQLDHGLLRREVGGVRPTQGGRALIARVQRALAYIERGGHALRRSARLDGLPHIERRVTLGQLRAFMAVDEAGSFALAASHTGLSQAALHRSARELERHLGVPLLAREGRTVARTSLGAGFLRFARLARAELEAGIDELASLQSRGGGRVRIGALPVVRSVLLPRALGCFANANVDAQVTLVEGPYLGLLNSLRHGELDVLVGAVRDRLPVRDVTQEEVFCDSPAIMGRVGHPLAGDAFAFERLSEFPWVVSAQGSPARARWERMFRERGLEPPRVMIASGSVPVIRGLMLEGDWLTLMSPDQVQFEIRAGLLRPIGPPQESQKRQLGLTYRSDWHPTGLQSAFLETFRAICAQWAEEKARGAGPFRFA